MKRYNLILFVLLLIILAQAGTDIYLPSLPAIKIALRTDIGYVQLTVSVFLASFALSQLIYGPLSDRFGRKLIVIFATGLYCLMSLLAACSTSIIQLLIVRAVQGVGAGGCSLISRSIVRDRFSGRELETIAVYLSLVWSLVPVLAPLLGSYVQHYLGWQYNFILLMVTSLIVFMMSLCFKETLLEKDKRLHFNDVFIQYIRIITNKKFLAPLFCAMGAVNLLIAFNVSAPVIIQEVIGLSTIEYGWSIFTVAVTYMLGVIVNRILMRFYQNDQIVGFGIVLLFLGAGLLYYTLFFKKLSLVLFLVPIIFMELGAAFIYPGSMAKTMDIFPDKAGKASAVFGSGLFLSGTVTSALISFLPMHNLLSLASITMAISILTLMAHYKYT